MPVPMTRGQFPNMFDKEIAKVFYRNYALRESEFDKIAKIGEFGKGRTLTQSEMTGLGSLRGMGEGEAISFDTIEEGHKKSIQPVKFGLGFQATEEMMNDEITGHVKQIPESLSDSAADCIETNFWALFNGAFSSVLGWDGAAVFGNHTIMKTGATVSNAGAADLTALSFEAAQLYYDTLVDETGRKIILKPNKLVIPPSLRNSALQLLKASGWIWSGQDLATGLSAASAGPGQSSLLNTANPKNGFFGEWQPVVSHYLTDDDAWFLLSDKHTFSLYWRKKPTMSSKDDFNTDNRLFKVVTRFACAVWDWKGAYGSPGAS